MGEAPANPASQGARPGCRVSPSFLQALALHRLCPAPWAAFPAQPTEQLSDFLSGCGGRGTARCQEPSLPGNFPPGPPVPEILQAEPQLTMPSLAAGEDALEQALSTTQAQRDCPLYGLPQAHPTQGQQTLTATAPWIRNPAPSELFPSGTVWGPEDLLPPICSLLYPLCLPARHSPPVLLTSPKATSP